jgi:ribosomal protein S18 acetylase RimI-like enzyme
VPTVRSATQADVSAVGELFARAFYDDPVAMFLQPDDARRRRHSPMFWRTVAAVAHSKGEVLTTTGGEAAALWLPPGMWRDRPRDMVRQLPLLLIAGRALPRVTRVFSLMQRHHPHEPHWYLETLGTDPPHQGKGFGSALMTPMLERCDQEGLPAYLESSKESNIPFYRRHGFEVTSELQVPDGPTLWPMWRDPR